MFIKQIVIDGVDGDVEIIWSVNADGIATATVVTDVRGHGQERSNRVVCRTHNTDGAEARWAAAVVAATAIAGTDGQGRSNASGSMILDVLRAIEQVVGG